MSDTVISRTIHEHRTRMGLSQKELGQMVGVTNRAVSKWENGLTFPSTEK